MPARTSPSATTRSGWKHTLAWIDDDERTVKLDYRPVHTQPLTNEVQSIPPKERVY